MHNCLRTVSLFLCNVPLPPSVSPSLFLPLSFLPSPFPYIFLTPSSHSFIGHSCTATTFQTSSIQDLRLPPTGCTGAGLCVVVVCDQDRVCCSIPSTCNLLPHSLSSFEAALPTVVGIDPIIIGVCAFGEIMKNQSRSTEQLLDRIASSLGEASNQVTARVMSFPRN